MRAEGVAEKEGRFRYGLDQSDHVAGIILEVSEGRRRVAAAAGARDGVAREVARPERLDEFPVGARVAEGAMDQRGGPLPRACK